MVLHSACCSQGKPLAVTETGWIGEDLSIPPFGLNVASSPARQDGFIDRLLDEANALDAGFVIWFTVVDYDSSGRTSSLGIRSAGSGRTPACSTRAWTHARA